MCVCVCVCVCVRLSLALCFPLSVSLCVSPSHLLWVLLPFLPLHHQHKCGIVHRDIKPSNFLFSRGAKGCLVDFGLASFMDPDSELLPTCTHSPVNIFVFASSRPPLSKHRRRHRHTTHINTSTHQTGVDSLICATTLSPPLLCLPLHKAPCARLLKRHSKRRLTTACGRQPRSGMHRQQ